MAEEVTVGLLVTLEAQPGKEAEVERFLDAGLTLVQQEPATTAWFGIRLGPSSYGIFDVFPDEAGREAHLQSQVAQALGVLQEMVRHGVRVPDEFAIVGYDDIDFAAAAAVPLSSVRQPRDELGRAAAELLIEETSGDRRHTHRQLVFEPDLVVRASSEYARLRNHPEVEHAVEA